MDFKKEIKRELFLRGFSEKTLINNEPLIDVVIDKTILLTLKMQKQADATLEKRK